MKNTDSGIGVGRQALTRTAPLYSALVMLWAWLGAPVLGQEIGQQGPGETGQQGPGGNRGKGKDKVDVSLTAPVSGALYFAPASVRLVAAATAKQKSHPIVKVEFFAG